MAHIFEQVSGYLASRVPPAALRVPESMQVDGPGDVLLLARRVVRSSPVCHLILSQSIVSGCDCSIRKGLRIQLTPDRLMDGHRQGKAPGSPASSVALRSPSLACPVLQPLTLLFVHLNGHLYFFVPCPSYFPLLHPLAG